MVDNTKEKDPKDDFEFEVEKPEIEIEDDTPQEDRGKTPMPKALVDELEADELEEYSDKVKTRLKQMKKVWHDERREKEIALREHQEAISLATRVMDENKRLKSTLSQGEQTLVSTYKNAAELEMAAAKKSYKEAYESGDSDKVVEAQEKMTNAGYRLEQIRGYRPTLQEPEPEIQNTQDVAQIPRPDSKTMAWQERNAWWGTDVEMTSLALGLHQKLERDNGKQFVGSDDYWQRVDETMRRRFPEYFGEEKPMNGGGKPVSRNESRAATVVAPASRSTSSKKIVLKQSQVNIARKLGLTPEQYAREMQKLEN